MQSSTNSHICRSAAINLTFPNVDCFRNSTVNIDIISYLWLLLNTSLQQSVPAMSAQEPQQAANQGPGIQDRLQSSRAVEQTLYPASSSGDSLQDGERRGSSIDLALAVAKDYLGGGSPSLSRVTMKPPNKESGRLFRKKKEQPKMVFSFYREGW